MLRGLGRCICVYVYICICIHVYLCIAPYTYIHTYIHIYIERERERERESTYIKRTYIYIYMDMCMLSMHAIIHAHARTHARTHANLSYLYAICIYAIHKESNMLYTYMRWSHWGCGGQRRGREKACQPQRLTDGQKHDTLTCFSSHTSLCCSTADFSLLRASRSASSFANLRAGWVRARSSRMSQTIDRPFIVLTETKSKHNQSASPSRKTSPIPTRLPNNHHHHTI